MMKRKHINKEKIRILIRESIKSNLKTSLIKEGDFFSDKGTFTTMGADSYVDLQEPEWEEFDPTLLMLIKDISEKGMIIFANAMEKLKFREKGIWSGLIDAFTRLAVLPLNVTTFLAEDIFNAFKKAYDLSLKPFRLPQYAIEQTIIDASKVIGKFIREVLGLYNDQENCGADVDGYLESFYDAVHQDAFQAGFIFNRDKYDRMIVKLSKSNNRIAESLDALDKAGYISFFLFMPNTYQKIAKGPFRNFRSENTTELRNAKKLVKNIKATVLTKGYDSVQSIFYNNAPAEYRRDLRRIFDRINLKAYGFDNTKSCKREYAKALVRGLEEVIRVIEDAE